MNPLPRDDPSVFIAGDLFWDPVADRRIAGSQAPDVDVDDPPTNTLAVWLRQDGRLRALGIEP